MTHEYAPEPYTDLGHGITCIDTGMFAPGMVAAYLIVENGRAGYVDTGALTCLPRLLGALEHVGLTTDDVDYIMPTHVHLDHAGAVGGLAQECPNAQVVIHPFGAKHLISPDKLKAGSEAVYGKQLFADLFGDIIPVSEDRVLIAQDGFKVQLGGRELVFIDTPGHARHHYCVWDIKSQGFFTGDTFGISYRHFDTADDVYLLPTTTPVQFDPQGWHDSLDRMLAYNPQRMYLTHFSMVENVPALAQRLRSGIDAYVEAAERLADSEKRHQAIKSALQKISLADLKALGCTLPEQRQKQLLYGDWELNAQGLGVWLDRRAA